MTSLQVEVELIDDLVESCIPGDVVTVVGIVKSVNSEYAAGRSGARAGNSSLFQLYILANSLVNSKQVR